MSQKREEKNFPLLRSYPNQKEFEKLKISDPLLWGEVKRLENFTKMISEEGGKKLLAQILRDILGAKGKGEEIYKELNESLKDAHQFVEEMICKYLPSRFKKVLNSEGKVNEEEDFITLLKKRQEFLKSDKRINKIREFEARRALLFAVILFHLKIHARKLHLNESSLPNFTSYLEKKFFKKDEVERKIIVSYHNPTDYFRIATWKFEENLSSITLKEGWKEKKTELECRKFDWEGRIYLVYFSCRNKTPFSHLLKMLRKDIRDPYSSALDRQGIKIVFFSPEEFEAGLSKLRHQAFPLFGTTWKLNDNRIFETTNPFSGKNFRAKKFITTFKGEPIEVIIETIENYLNGVYSLGEENHHLYRLRQLIKSGFPLIFPQEIYEIDWENKEIQEEIINVFKI